MLNYIKKNFQTPENGLMQTIITHLLFFSVLLVLKTIHKLTGVFDLEKIYSYLHLSAQEVYFKPWTIVSYCMVHKTIWGMVINLMSLYHLGKVVVYLMGNRKFLVLYFVGSMLGGGLFVVAYHLLPYFIALQKAQAISIVLSGGSIGIYALVAGLVTFAPNFSFYPSPFFPVKIKYLALAFLVWPVVAISYTDGQEALNIARLGSALWGYIYIKLVFLSDRTAWRSWLSKAYEKIKKKRDSLTKRIKKEGKQEDRFIEEEGVYVSKEEVNKILDKIALHGYEKLTSEEKRKLFHAGKR